MKKSVLSAISVILVFSVFLTAGCATNVAYTTSSKEGDLIIELAGTYMREGEYEKALDVFERGKDLAGSDIRVLYNKTVCTAMLGRYIEAAEMCSQYFKAFPEMLRFKRAEAFYRMEAGDYEGSLKAFNEAIALNPYDSEALFGEYQVLFSLGRYDEAMEYLRDAVLAGWDGELDGKSS